MSADEFAPLRELATPKLGESSSTLGRSSSPHPTGQPMTDTKKRAPHESTGTSTTKVYRVEARVRNGGLPTPLGCQIIAGEWVSLDFERAAGGVPNHLYEPQAVRQGFLDFTAATALMAWAGASDGLMSPLEFRLRQYEFHSTYRVTSLGVGEPVNYLEVMFKAKFTPDAPPTEQADGN